MRVLIISLLCLGIILLNANETPIVSNMSAAQRTDGSYLVDVYYNVQDTDSALLTISLMVSSDGGTTWNVSCDQLSGDIGGNISPGSNKHITWNLGSEHPNIEANYHFKVIADDGYVPPVPEYFVLVPGGTFIMGRTTGVGGSDELPTHSVNLNSFYMGKYEVTQGEYQAIMGSNPANNYGVGTIYPVYYVSWYAVLRYCNLLSINEGLEPVYSISGATNPTYWGDVPTSNNNDWNSAICNWNANGYRLPTEAEWEYAARGATNSPDYQYSGSNVLSDVAWFLGNSSPIGSKPVGTKTPNALGIFDMSGNASEWCWDWYSNTYYSSCPSSNPTGPLSGSSRVFRGGSWYSAPPYCRVAFRSKNNPDNILGNYNIGFRLCRTSL